MQRGNLVIYDPGTGKIWAQTGEATGDIIPHDYPVGLPFIEVPFGTMATKFLISIDISDPSSPAPIFEDMPIMQTPGERIAELENQLLIAEGVI